MRGDGDHCPAAQTFWVKIFFFPSSIMFRRSTAAVLKRANCLGGVVDRPCTTAISVMGLFPGPCQVIPCMQAPGTGATDVHICG